MKRNKTVIALGMFDGVHRGHRALLRGAAALAKSCGAEPVCYTFETHPAALFGADVSYLISADQRRRALLANGVTKVEMVPFTRALADLSPRSFVERMLETYALAAVVVGFNYTFGRGGAGTPDTLAALGREYGFGTKVVPPVLEDGEPISSTRIRRALAAGELEAACALLGRPYTLLGTVVKNRGIGHTLGFPTANLDCGIPVPLPDGVYATATVAEDAVFPSVTNIGCNPTVGGRMRTLETHILGGNFDLYGKELRVCFLERIRGEIRFADTEKLISRVSEDAKTAQIVYEQRKKSVYNPALLW